MNNVSSSCEPVYASLMPSERPSLPSMASEVFQKFLLPYLNRQEIACLTQSCKRLYQMSAADDFYACILKQLNGEYRQKPVVFQIPRNRSWWEGCFGCGDGDQAPLSPATEVFQLIQDKDPMTLLLLTQELSSEYRVVSLREKRMASKFFETVLLNTFCFDASGRSVLASPNKWKFVVNNSQRSIAMVSLVFKLVHQFPELSARYYIDFRGVLEPWRQLRIANQIGTQEDAEYDHMRLSYAHIDVGYEGVPVHLVEGYFSSWKHLVQRRIPQAASIKTEAQLWLLNVSDKYIHTLHDYEEVQICDEILSRDPDNVEAQVYRIKQSEDTLESIQRHFNTLWEIAWPNFHSKRQIPIRVRIEAKILIAYFLNISTRYDELKKQCGDIHVSLLDEIIEHPGAHFTTQIHAFYLRQYICEMPMERGVAFWQRIKASAFSLTATRNASIELIAMKLRGFAIPAFSLELLTPKAIEECLGKGEPRFKYQHDVDQNAMLLAFYTFSLREYFGLGTFDVVEYLEARCRMWSGRTHIEALFCKTRIAMDGLCPERVTMTRPEMIANLESVLSMTPKQVRMCLIGEKIKIEAQARLDELAMIR